MARTGPPPLATAEALTLPARRSAPAAESWSLWRYRHAVSWLRRQSPRPRTLIDLGCGTGNGTCHLIAELGLRRALGIEEDPVQLRAARARGLAVRAGSLLDVSLATDLEERFDVVLLGDVLHHLTGPGAESRRSLARRALVTARRLVAPGGSLVVLEPVYRSRLLRAGSFQLKRLTSRWLRRRCELGASWLNVGPPVVRFFDRAELVALLAEAGWEIAALIESDQDRLGGIWRRGRLTALARPQSKRSTSTAIRSPERR
ncbi:MAG: class I SAM-dependent methyltransferase [Acidobacteriota bacterium]